jgi:sugar phosphate permease
MSTSNQSRIVHRWPFFYGWIIVAVATLGVIMTQPGQTPVISIFVDRFIADLNLSRSVVSTLFMIGTLVGGFSLPFWGRQIDRHGPRVLVGVITALFGLTCIYLGFVKNALMLGVAFVALRMLGASALGLVSRNVINQWWMHSRGLIMGISGVAVALAGMGLFPNLVHALLQGYGWRTTYPILGGVLLLGMLPLGLFFFRDRPEDHGLLPDGRPAAKAGAAGNPCGPATAAQEVNWTLREALHTWAFWIPAISIGLMAMLGTGLYFHMVSIFEDQGLSAAVAAAVYVPISITAALARLGGGYLADRISAHYLLVVALVLLTLGMGMLPFLNSVPLALLYGVLTGLRGGLTAAVGGVVWAQYFGRRHLGSIAGTASTVGRVSSALGPLPLGLARDLLGSYNGALLILSIFPLALAGVSLWVGGPKDLDRRKD